MKKKQNSVMDMFNLPSYTKGKTFAEASKAIEGKFKDRNDKASLDTKAELLSRLRGAQEHIKMQTEVAQQAEASQNQANFGALFGQADGGAPVQAVGGNLAAQGIAQTGPSAATQLASTPGIEATADAAGGGAAAGGGPGVGGYMQAATGALEIGKNLFGKADIGDTSGRTRHAQVDKGKEALGGAMEGAQAGMAFGPWGAAIGGAAGFVGGVVGGGKKAKAVNEANHDNTQMQAKDIRKVAHNKPLELPGQDPNQNQAFLGKLFGKKEGGTAVGNFLRDKFVSQEEGEKSKAGQFLQDHGADALQYAPILGELFNKVERGTTERGTRLTGRAKLDRADEATTQNLIDDQNVFEGVKASAAGNLGALMAGNLAANLGKTKAKSAAYATDRGFNAGQQEKELKLDRQADLANMAADERYINRKDADEGAYQTAKDARRASILNSIGGIGREESNKKLMKEMFGYSWNGEYWQDSEGNEVDPEDVSKAIGKGNKTKANMFGGYLKKK